MNNLQYLIVLIKMFSHLQAIYTPTHKATAHTAANLSIALTLIAFAIRANIVILAIQAI